MKQCIFFLILLLPFLNAFSQSKNIDSAMRQNIIQLDQTCNDAVLAGNTKEINNLFANGFKDYYGDQAVNKDTLLKQYTKPTTGVTIKNIKIEATIYGNAAVAHGVREEKDTGYNNNKPSYVEFTDMFAKEKNKWEIVASQENEIAAWNVRNLEDGEFDTITAEDCDKASTLKSLNSNIPTILRIKNNTSGNITVTWIDYSGKRDTRKDQAGELAPGTTYNTHTYFTHPFIVIDAKGTCRGIYKTTTNP